MKKLIAVIFAFLFVFCGCSAEKAYDVEITVPAGTVDEYVMADVEICPVKNNIVISAGAGISSAKIILESASDENITCGPEVLKQQEPIKFGVEKDMWYKIGISVDNPSDKDITVSVTVKNADIRIE